MRDTNDSKKDRNILDAFKCDLRRFCRLDDKTSNNEIKLNYEAYTRLRG